MELSAKQKILKQIKTKKIARPGDFTDVKDAHIHLAQLAKKGALIRIGRGLYAPADYNFGERQSLLEAARLIPKGVVCLVSALNFHNLTTQNPFEIWIAIEGTGRKPQIESLPLNVFRFSGNSYHEGIEIHQIKGGALRVYNPAKTVADCFKYRNKIGLDIALEALRDAWRQKKATADELWHFAKICRMSNVMRPYLESLV